jgi:hypothetical protein
MKLDPGMHIGMHLVSFGKSGVTETEPNYPKLTSLWFWITKLTPWNGKLMNKSGRLIVVQSVASTIPIYTLMGDDLPAWAVEEIDALRRNFF